MTCTDIPQAVRKRSVAPRRHLPRSRTLAVAPLRHAQAAGRASRICRPGCISASLQRRIDRFECFPAYLGYRVFDIGVIEDEHGVLPTELERDALQVRRSGSRHDSSSDGRAPRECELAHARMGCQRLAGHGPNSRYDIQGPGGEARLCRERGELQRGQWRQLGGLEYDGIPGRERWCYAPHGQKHWSRRQRWAAEREGNVYMGSSTAR